MPEEDGLAGQVALVTGSSRGIGAAIARRLAAAGAAVAVHGRDAAAAAEVAAQIERLAAEAAAVLADLTRYDEVQALRAAVERQLGPVDVLVANAGGSTIRPSRLEDIPEDGWRASLEANLTATFLTLKAFLPGMRERGRGAIITMSSAATRRPSAASPMAYAAAKAGIELLTKELAADAGAFGIRVNCIAPETIMTERNQQQIPADVQERLRVAHPVQRLGTPDDVARAALFLATEQSSWISGVTLDVAGGSVLA